MNNQIAHNLDEVVRELNKAIQNAVCLGYDRSRRLSNKDDDLHIRPLTIQDIKETMRGLNKAVHLDSENPEAYINRGTFYYYIGDYDHEISDYDQAISLDPQCAKAYFNRGNAYFRKGAYDQAIADYGNAIQINPQSAEVYFARSEVYDRNGDSDLANIDADKASELGFDLEEYVEYLCFKPLNDLVEICPKNAKIYYNRGLAHTENGDYDPAIADYNEVIRLNPEDAKVYYLRGFAYQNRYNESDYDRAIAHDRAIADYDKATQINPKCAKAYYERGNIYLYKQDYDRAVADYDKATQINLKYGEAYGDVGDAYERIAKESCDIDNYDKAISAYDKAILYYEKAGSHSSLTNYELAVDAYIYRGEIYAKKGDYDNAILDMNRAIELDDNMSTDYDEGFRRGPEYDPDSYPSNYGSEKAGKSYNNKGFYYFKKGEYDLAIESFMEVLRLYNESVELFPESNPDFATIYLNLGSLYCAKRDYDIAVENYDNVVRLCPNYQTDFIESKFAHGGQKAVNEAIELLNRRVNTPPENATDYYYIGVQRLLVNDRLSARRSFEIALKLDYNDQQKIEKHLENLKRPQNDELETVINKRRLRQRTKRRLRQRTSRQTTSLGELLRGESVKRLELCLLLRQRLDELLRADP